MGIKIAEFKYTHLKYKAWSSIFTTILKRLKEKGATKTLTS